MSDATTTDPATVLRELPGLDLAGMLRALHGLGWAGGVNAPWVDSRPEGAPTVWVYRTDERDAYGIEPHEEPMGDDPVGQLRALLGRLLAGEVRRRAEEGEDG